LCQNLEGLEYSEPLNWRGIGGVLQEHLVFGKEDGFVNIQMIGRGATYSIEFNGTNSFGAAFVE